jgi:hypothetical protein
MRLCRFVWLHNIKSRQKNLDALFANRKMIALSKNLRNFATHFCQRFNKLYTFQTMKLTLAFLLALAAALNSAHAQTALVFTSNATLPSSPAGSPASIPVQITGGTQPYSFTLKRGQTLPTGLELDPSTGVISGTPRGPSSTEIQVQVRDSGAPVRYKAKNFILPISGDSPALPTFKLIEPSVVFAI